VSGRIAERFLIGPEVGRANLPATAYLFLLRLVDSVARRSWVLRGVIHGFSEEARTRDFASLTLVRFAFVECSLSL
jgi:hypothetical protein